ncbi:hypothetical protein [Paludisphaera mucosa]|uniref:RCK C-terminal domain-containing protein n=1 Tax=Paludisphaera mucosa TaxID=3030827 RepID=A0ABT6FIY8_9BACT|nr:hypothetical protein [Paludisphaera mucosa]MDG3007360.1 hypothetical protein [Paludisphaera mucosa]
MPTDPNEIEIPTSALVEDGDESVVFVQPDPGRPSYELRHVAILRHTSDVAFVRAAAPRAGEGDLAKAVAIGERVVVSGALELRAALKELRAAARDRE